MDMLSFYYLLLLTCLAHPVTTLLAQPPLPNISSRITVVGAVYCDTCLSNAFSRHSYFLPGVDVNVKCKFNANAPRTTEMITIAVNRSTDNSGVYRVEIPSVDGVDCVDGPPIQFLCQATLLWSSSTSCNVASLKLTTDAISVKSKHDNLCVYAFTPLSFRPRKRNVTLCGLQADNLSDKRARTTKFPPSATPNLQKQNPQLKV